jgi:hypothetical protein
MLLVSAGCAPQGPEQTVENYSPLAIGNFWAYYKDSLTPAETVVIDKAILNSDKVVVYIWGGMYVSNADGRVLLRDDINDVGTPILCEPFVTGATWLSEYGDTVRVVDTKADISIRAGRFTDCVEVTGEDGSIAVFAPGVGLVKANDGVSDWGLSDYDLR